MKRSACFVVTAFPSSPGTHLFSLLLRRHDVERGGEAMGAGAERDGAMPYI